MKIRVVMGGIALLAVSIGFAQEPAMPGPSSPPTTTAPAPKQDAPKTTTASDKAKADAKKKVEKEEPPIEGIAITRSTAGLLGFKITDNVIILTFFDLKRKKVPVDVVRGVARWQPRMKPASEQAVLNPAGTALVSEKSIPAPHNIKFTLLLFKEGSDEAAETYFVDYHD
jgi:hypothetical protein